MKISSSLYLTVKEYLEAGFKVSIKKVPDLILSDGTETKDEAYEAF